MIMKKGTLTISADGQVQVAGYEFRNVSVQEGIQEALEAGLIDLWKARARVLDPRTAVIEPLGRDC